MFAISCPCGCGKTLHLPDQMRGKSVVCPQSGRRFTAQVETQTCTEATWQRGQDPASVQRYIMHFGTARKMLLVAVGFCRFHETFMRNRVAEKTLQTIEAFIDGQATRKEVRGAISLTGRFLNPRVLAAGLAAGLAYPALGEFLQDDARVTMSTCWKHAQVNESLSPEERRLREIQAMHEIFGNPFDPTVVQPEWLAWHDRTALRIAQKIYDERQWQDLPILADALEDSGCDAPAVLSHLRSPGPHLRGCWALDRVLGLR